MNQIPRVKDCLEELEEIEEKWLGCIDSIGKFLNTFDDDPSREAVVMLILDKFREANEEERHSFTAEQTLWRMASAWVKASLGRLNEEWSSLMTILDKPKGKVYFTIPRNHDRISVIMSNGKPVQIKSQLQKKQDPVQLDLFI